jgi:tRNA threonylcarbamoyladenosine biosynthesis protein TsaE
MLKGSNRYNTKEMKKNVNNQQELAAVGERLGALLKGGEVIELVGDVGAGKTTFTKAIAGGMGVDGDVSSPSYTLSQVYEAKDGLRLVHYDFYRLHDPGILAAELEEAMRDDGSVIVIEWADIVAGLLPPDHLQVHILATGEVTRQLSFTSGGEKSRRLEEQLQ